MQTNRKRSVWPRFIVFVAATAAAAQPLADSLQKRIADFTGAVSLYAKNLETGATIGIRESEPVRTASTIKLPIMAAVFDAVARGQARWTEPLTVTAAEKVSGSGIIRVKSPTASNSLSGMCCT
jgi:beta-lactamase class A